MSNPKLTLQLKTMLVLQSNMNALVFDDWNHRNFAWHRAIYVEAAEMLEHLGAWKWWKKGQPDIAQAQIELVDIWHFGLSMLLLSTDSAKAQPDDEDLELLVRSLDYLMAKASHFPCATSETWDLLTDQRHNRIDQLIANAAKGSFDLEAFIQLIPLLGMDYDMLYRMYVGKNMLNVFRQKNGYKTGTYVKIWAGREDNQHLEELLNELPSDDSLPDSLLQALQSRYVELTKR